MTGKLLEELRVFRLDAQTLHLDLRVCPRQLKRALNCAHIAQTFHNIEYSISRIARARHKRELHAFARMKRDSFTNRENRIENRAVRIGQRIIECDRI